MVGDMRGGAIICRDYVDCRRRYGYILCNDWIRYLLNQTLEFITLILNNISIDQLHVVY